FQQRNSQGKLLQGNCEIDPFPVELRDFAKQVSGVLKFEINEITRRSICSKYIFEAESPWEFHERVGEFIAVTLARPIDHD
ncbi:hypothetical protein K0M31_008366, partial [Melipona bicolor]